MTPNNPEKGKQTGQGNAPVEQQVYSTMAGHEYGEVPANAYSGYAPPMEREIAIRSQWMQWQAKYPFTLDKVDRFLLAVERNGIRPADCFIALPEENDTDSAMARFWELTVHGYSDVRLCGEMGGSDEYDDDCVEAVDASSVELQAYHRGFNVWVVVPMSRQSIDNAVKLIEAAKEVQ